MTRIVECQIIQGIADIWITMRDSIDCDNSLNGKTYRNPSHSSLMRVFNAINNYCTVEIIPDGYGFYLIARQNQCPTCGDDKSLEPGFDLPGYIDAYWREHEG